MVGSQILCALCAFFADFAVEKRLTAEDAMKAQRTQRENI